MTALNDLKPGDKFRVVAKNGRILPPVRTVRGSAEYPGYLPTDLRRDVLSADGRWMRMARNLTVVVVP